VPEFQLVRGFGVRSRRCSRARGEKDRGHHEKKEFFHPEPPVSVSSGRRRPGMRRKQPAMRFALPPGKKGGLSGPCGRDAPFVLFLLHISVRLFWVKQLAEIQWIFREKLHL